MIFTLKKVLTIGLGNQLRAIKKTIGTLEIVVVEWNYIDKGFFEESMLWYRTRKDNDWILMYLDNWSSNYVSEKDFLEDFPEFTDFFTGEWKGTTMDEEEVQTAKRWARRNSRR